MDLTEGHIRIHQINVSATVVLNNLSRFHFNFHCSSHSCSEFAAVEGFFVYLLFLTLLSLLVWILTPLVIALTLRVVQLFLDLVCNCTRSSFFRHISDLIFSCLMWFRLKFADFEELVELLNVADSMAGMQIILWGSSSGTKYLIKLPFLHLNVTVSILLLTERWILFKFLIFSPMLFVWLPSKVLFRSSAFKCFHSSYLHVLNQIFLYPLKT